MIQIDMPTPKNCADCCFATADLINGIITLFCMTPVGRKMYAPDLISRKDRPEWCPIKEQQNVVRCKDCKHRGNYKKCVLSAISEENEFPLFILDNRGDWFCADGERKDI